jgi:hypothetical protein
MQQLIGRTGGTIFLNNIDPKEFGWWVRKGYAFFYITQWLCFFAWAASGSILATTSHGKDFRNAFNDPPIAAWVIATISAFIIM